MVLQTYLFLILPLKHYSEFVHDELVLMPDHFWNHKFYSFRFKKKLFQSKNTIFPADFLRSYIGCIIKTYILGVELPKTFKSYECVTDWIV